MHQDRAVESFFLVLSLQMSQFWSLHDSVLTAALLEIWAGNVHVWVCRVLRVKLRAVREAWSWIFWVFCRVQGRLVLLGLERGGGRLVIPAQMDITQAGESGAARGGGRGRGWGGGGGVGGGGVEALHSLVLFLLHPPVLEPNLNLPLLEVEQSGHLHPPRPAQVAAEVKLLLQLHQLRTRVRGARPLGGRGRAWRLLGAVCGDKQSERSFMSHSLCCSLQLTQNNPTDN